MRSISEPESANLGTAACSISLAPMKLTAARRCLLFAKSAKRQAKAVGLSHWSNTKFALLEPSRWSAPHSTPTPPLKSQSSQIARQLGLNVPRELLATADEMIE
jgi:hypothetical protein